MASLYEINEEILNCIDLETGEILDEEKFNQLSVDRNDKIENIALYYKNLLSEADAIKSEKEMFAHREKVIRNKAENLKKYLDSSLKGDKFSTVKVNISYRNSTCVDVDEEKIDAKWLKTITTTSVDKIKITEALKAGESISGAVLVEKKNINIK